MKGQRVGRGQGPGVAEEGGQSSCAFRRGATRYPSTAGAQSGNAALMSVIVT